MLYVPVGTLDAAVNVSVDEPLPGALMVDGLKDAVIPEGSPEVDSDTGELKPFTRLELTTVDELPPGGTSTDDGEAVRVNVAPN